MGHASACPSTSGFRRRAKRRLRVANARSQAVEGMVLRGARRGGGRTARPNATRSRAPMSAIHRLRFLNGGGYCDNRRYGNWPFKLLPNAHGSPVVGKLPAAIETYDIRAVMCCVLRPERAGSPSGRHGKSCARMSASKQRVNQRLKHVGPLLFLNLLDTVGYPNVALSKLKMLHTLQTRLQYFQPYGVAGRRFYRREAIDSAIWRP